MFVIRDIMYCKPGQVRAMADKFVAMSKLGARMGMPPMRVMTDFCAERYWTVVAEMEVPDLDTFDRMTSSTPAGASPEAMQEFEQIMQGYHDLVAKGRREIYRLHA